MSPQRSVSSVETLFPDQGRLHDSAAVSARLPPPCAMDAFGFDDDAGAPFFDADWVDAAAGALNAALVANDGKASGTIWEDITRTVSSLAGTSAALVAAKDKMVQAIADTLPPSAKAAYNIRLPRKQIGVDEAASITHLREARKKAQIHVGKIWRRLCRDAFPDEPLFR